jgi:sRNA-binding protein
MPAEKHTLFQDSTQLVKKLSGISKQKLRDSLIAILVLQWYFKATIDQQAMRFSL